MQQHIIVDGEDYFIDRPSYTAMGYEVTSRLLVCPVCCRTWARLTADSKPLHDPCRAVCARCSWPRDASGIVPGSLLQWRARVGTGDDEDLIDLLPMKLLKREFELADRRAQEYIV